MGDNLQHTKMMPEHDISQGDGLDRTADAPCLDIFTYPKGVIEKEEEPGKYIRYQFLGTKTDG